MDAVVARNLSKIAGGKRILSHVEFGAEEGSAFGILGPNASGKTTLLRIVSTMLLPDEGSCEVYGLDVIRNERAVRRLLGFVSPDLSFHDRFTPREVAEFYRRVAKVDVGKVREVLKRCGLLNIWNKWWGYLSYGERIIFIIAIALGRRPKLLVLDEPTTNLDATNRVVVSDLLLEEKITSLVATHDMSFAKKTIGKCIVLNEGRVVLSGEIDSLVKKLKFKTAIEASLGSFLDDKTLESMCASHRRKPDSHDVTFYVERDDEKIELMRRLIKLPSLRGVTMSEPSVEDLIFWVKSHNADREKKGCLEKDPDG
jgi:ABC-type multidrug transport system ATPase subunit